MSVILGQQGLTQLLDLLANSQRPDVTEYLASVRAHAPVVFARIAELDSSYLRAVRAFALSRDRQAQFELSRLFDGAFEGVSIHPRLRQYFDQNVVGPDTFFEVAPEKNFAANPNTVRAIVLAVAEEVRRGSVRVTCSTASA